MIELPNTFFIYIQQPCGANGFVNYWRHQFVFPSMEVYERAITVRPVNETQLRELFTWKNGMNLSVKKTTSLSEKIIKKLSVINELIDDFDKVKFNHHFGQLRIVWKAFLLHIVNPDRFPIFDQHVNRAHLYLSNSKGNEIKEELLTHDHYEKYCVFYKVLCDQYNGNRVKDVDEALWAFGKFLFTYSQTKLLQ